MKRVPDTDDESVTAAKILDAARGQVRRFGEAKTNVVDIARALGTSHTTIYRHFRSKAEVFDAIAAAAMQDEQEMARAFVDADGPAPERLHGMVLALHRRKREKFEGDQEVYQLYRRVLEERPELVRDYSAAMTELLSRILADGVRRREYVLDDVQIAASVVRDAVTVFVHPGHVEAAVRAGMALEPAIEQLMATLNFAFKAGIRFRK